MTRLSQLFYLPALLLSRESTALEIWVGWCGTPQVSHQSDSSSFFVLCLILSGMSWILARNLENGYSAAIRFLVLGLMPIVTFQLMGLALRIFI